MRSLGDSFLGGNEVNMGFAGGSVVKNLLANAGDTADMGSIAEEEGRWQHTPEFLPGKCHGQRSLAATINGVIKSWT